MKKIVGIIAAVAMAASAFAADVSSGTRIDGSIFKYDGGIHFLSEDNASQGYSMPNFSFNASGDRAGASLVITTRGTNDTPSNTVEDLKNQYVPVMTSQTIWFKPFDMLKITVGNGDVALNKETIDWTGSTTGIDGRGFYLEFRPVDGLSIDAVLTHNNEGFWLDKAKDGEAAISRMYFKGAYSADFGSIGAYADITPKGNMEFGAGWKNGGALGPVNTLFIQAIGGFDKDFGLGEIRAEVFANMGFDAIGLGVFVAGGYVGKNQWIRLDDWWRTGTGANPEEAYVGTVVKLSFPVAGANGYVYIKDTNLLAKDFSMTIKPGISGNIGAMGWDVAVDITAKKDLTVNVPFTLTVGF